MLTDIAQNGLSLRTLPDAVGNALSLNEAVFVAVQTAPQGVGLVLLIVLLAGLSQALGQSIVLFANRVRPHRFVASLLLSASIYAFGFLLLTTSIWLVSRYVFDSVGSLRVATKAVGLGYSPYLFSFFILTPYFGTPISALLSLWSLLAIVLAVRISFDLTLVQALLCSALGWLLLQVMQRTIGRPVVALAKWLRRQISGVQLITNRDDLRDAVRAAFMSDRDDPERNGEGRRNRHRHKQQREADKKTRQNDAAEAENRAAEEDDRAVR